MTYLVKFSFGPVQDFIAAARKLEDLWAGSQMLGDLMERAHEAARRTGAEIIYPVSGTLAINPPNILLLKIDSAPPLVAETIIGAVENRFFEMVRKGVEDAGELDVPGVVNRQMKNFLEIVWVATETTTSFSQAMKCLKRGFDAAKRTRVFHQQVEEGLKCTLHPALAALAPPALIETTSGRDRAIRRYWRNLSGRAGISKEIVSLVNSENGERFSAIGLTKRRYRRRTDHSTPQSPFPSTYAVSTALWRRRILNCALKDTEFQEALKSHVDKIQAFRDDHSAVPGQEELFARAAPDTLSALAPYRNSPCGALLNWEPQCFIETDPDELEKDLLRRQAGMIQKLLDTVRKFGCGIPPRHYALILADGDSMGDVVNARSGPADIQKMSAALNAFAARAVMQVSGPAICGRAIYAGGDDVMAVAPVETSIAAACQWRRFYREEMTGYGFDAENGTLPATLSVAVVAAPVNYPLNRLLEDGRFLLEHRAKSEDKDAMSVAVIRGDSEVCTVTLPTESEPWQAASNGWRLEAWAEEAGKRAAARSISSKSMYDLKRDLGLLARADSDRPELILNVAMAKFASNRRMAPKELTAIHDLMDGFLHALGRIGDYRGHRRFSSPDLLADVLMTFRQMRRMACL